VVRLAHAVLLAFPLAPSFPFLPLRQLRRPNGRFWLLLLQYRNFIPQRLNLLALLMNDFAQRGVLFLERPDQRGQILVCGQRRDLSMKILST